MKSSSFTNDLRNESSPYLLQHAHNPINWKAWNEATLQKAKIEKKLMIISIGYSACHWCHVMEKESFEDTAIAAVMNADFISIKVDREERPDVDQTYINAVQIMTGSAGWPLNVVALPDGRPVWGGTYFRNNEWLQALTHIQELYVREPEKLLAYANRLEAGLKNLELISLNTESIDFKKFPTAMTIQKWSRQFDLEMGGFKGAPKFMMPNNLQFLLRQAVYESNKGLMEFVVLTLNKMAHGGLYDHIGGGFARYSTDEKWHVPHFEKMLYDNAQLVSLYSQAYSATKNPLYAEIVKETLSFIARELTGEHGNFYSALDADSLSPSGKLSEGAFYVFSSEELKALLQDDFPIFAEYYNVNSYGLWEDDAYVLIRKKTDSEIESQFGMGAEQFQRKKEQWKKKLLDYRNKRQRPRLDGKTLTSWNGLMLKGYIDAYKAFGNQAYLETALLNANFILENQLQKNGALFHSFINGKSSINGFLEDYAFVVDAFISLYQITLAERWLTFARKMTEYALAHFFSIEKHMFYFTSKEDPEIVLRNFEYRDNVIPSSNSVMAKNLFLLSKYFADASLEEKSRQMLKNVLGEMGQYPGVYSNWMDLLANFQQPFFETVVVGEHASETIKTLAGHYFPNVLFAGSKVENSTPLFKNRYVEGETVIYICQNNACQTPIKNSSIAIELLNKKE